MVGVKNMTITHPLLQISSIYYYRACATWRPHLEPVEGSAEADGQGDQLFHSVLIYSINLLHKRIINKLLVI
jgi:hypothetical protein